MALLLKCDICGELYDYMNSDIGRSILSLKNDNRLWDNTQHYDLCPRCYDHMLKLIKEAKMTFQGGQTND